MLGRSITVEVQVIVSDDDRINGMLFDDTRFVPPSPSNQAPKSSRKVGEKVIQKNGMKDGEKEVEKEIIYDGTEEVEKEVVKGGSSVGDTSTRFDERIPGVKGPRNSGMAEVVLSVDRDGFVDLFMALLSSLP